MKKKSKKPNSNIEQIIIYTAVLIVLLLTAFNLQNYLGDKKVLGVSVSMAHENIESISDRLFWEDVVEKNPSYIPGWIELGRMDKVREIDPNYELVISD